MYKVTIEMVELPNNNAGMRIDCDHDEMSPDTVVNMFALGIVHVFMNAFAAHVGVDNIRKMATTAINNAINLLCYDSEEFDPKYLPFGKKGKG